MSLYHNIRALGVSRWWGVRIIIGQFSGNTFPVSRNLENMGIKIGSEMRQVVVKVACHNVD